MSQFVPETAQPVRLLREALPLRGLQRQRRMNAAVPFRPHHARPGSLACSDRHAVGVLLSVHAEGHALVLAHLTAVEADDEAMEFGQK